MHYIEIGQCPVPVPIFACNRPRGRLRSSEAGSKPQTTAAGERQGTIIPAKVGYACIASDRSSTFDQIIAASSGVGPPPGVMVASSCNPDGRLHVKAKHKKLKVHPLYHTFQPNSVSLSKIQFRASTTLLALGLTQMLSLLRIIKGTCLLIPGFVQATPKPDPVAVYPASEYVRNPWRVTEHR